MSDQHDHAPDSHQTDHHGPEHAAPVGPIAAPGGVAAEPLALPSLAAGDPRLDGRGNGPVRAAIVQRMQRSYGNRATGRLLRQAADPAGPAPAAGPTAPAPEQAVAAAATDSGAPLPGPLQTKFAASLGADLAGVRVHTGPDSAQAAQSVAALAYTVGQDIHFGSGAYAPETPGGEQLLAHEVAHTVQQTGGGAAAPQFKLEVSAPGDAAEVEADTAAAAMVRGDRAAVSPAAGGIARQPLAAPVADPPDMAPFDWAAASTPGTPIGDDPQMSIVLPVPDKPPPLPANWPPKRQLGPNDIPPEVNNPPMPPSHHQDPPFHMDPRLVMDMERSMRLGFFRNDAAALVENWGSVAPLVRAFAQAQTDPSLQRVNMFQIAPGTQGNVHSVANQQVVGAKGTKVGDVFGGVTVAGQRISTGTDAQYDAKAAQRAGGSAAVKDLRVKALAADDALGKEMSLFDEARLKVKAAQAGIDAAFAQMEKTAAAEEQAQAQKDLAAVQQSKADTVAAVGLALKTVEILAGAATIKGGAKGVAGGLAPDVAGNAVHDLVGMAAEQIVAPFYADQIRDAEQKVQTAAQHVKDALAKFDLATYNKAVMDFLASLAGLRAWRQGVEEKLKLRKAAYDALAAAAGAAAGGGAAGERIQAVIAAIPIAEAVAGKATGVANAISLPAYSPMSGSGYALARATGSVSPILFLVFLRQLRGAQDEYRQHADHWTARVKSLRAILDQIGGVPGPGH